MMSTTFWIQLLGVIFGSAMLYFTFVKYKRKELSPIEYALWFSGWALLIFIAIVPSLLDFIIAPLRFYRRLDFFVVLGFFVLLGLEFYNYGTSKKLEKKMETLVRKKAVQEHEDQQEQSKQSESEKQ